jgi:hypothetical protein
VHCKYISKIFLQKRKLLKHIITVFCMILGSLRRWHYKVYHCVGSYIEVKNKPENCKQFITLTDQTVLSQFTCFKSNVNKTNWFTNNPIGLWLRVMQLPRFLQLHLFHSSIAVDQSTTFPHPWNIAVCQGHTTSQVLTLCN